MSLIVEKAKDVKERLTSHGIGFYTSGQLFLEEYVTLAIIGKAGLGTLHMDGNTRLCTATAATTMRERCVGNSSWADVRTLAQEKSILFTINWIYVRYTASESMLNHLVTRISMSVTLSVS